MAIFEVDESDFDEIRSQELNEGKFIILKFGSQLCDACQALDFELEELEEIENISILEIESSDSEELCESYGIQRVPTIIIYNPANQMIFRHEGVILYQDILEIIKK
jgi:thioredoxin 1